MINETIAQIRARLNTSASIPEERREELLGLLENLESEINELSRTDADKARNIAGFADASAYEATRQPQNPESLKDSLTSLGSSVTEFERSHPKLVTVVNSISRTLSNLGI